MSMQNFVPRGYGPDVVRGHIRQWFFDLEPRIVQVQEVVRLSASMVRVRFTGPELASLATVAAEDHVKLFFDKHPDGSVRMPVLDEDGRWSTAGFTYRDYTIRAFDPDTLLLDIDFVLHGNGTASSWARQAAPGMELGMLGPRGSFEVLDECDFYVFACDQTALPAVARWLEGLRPGVPATAYVEVDGPEDEMELSTAARLELVWLHRRGAPAGTTRLLEGAVRAHRMPSSGLGFVWVAGESTSIKLLRRHLARERGLERDSWDVDGYWRRGTSNHDHHDEPEDAPDEPDDTSAAEPVDGPTPVPGR